MSDYEDSYRQLAKSIGVPLIPKRHEPPNWDPNGPIAVCGECGTTVYRVMSYSCPHRNCPCGLGSSGSLCLNNDTELSGSLK